MAKRLCDHFVPRLLIRQFCNSKGRIYCFDKEKGRIPDREVGNTPREILHKKAFYADPLGNLDEELSRSRTSSVLIYYGLRVIRIWP